MHRTKKKEDELKRRERKLLTNEVVERKRVQEESAKEKGESRIGKKRKKICQAQEVRKEKDEVFRKQNAYRKKRKDVVRSLVLTRITRA